MEILITRRWQGNASTLSTLSVNGKAQHFILEDADRGLNSEMSLAEILKKKIKKETAIPTGRYRIMITYSTRFKRMLPIFIGVPGYAGIRFHPGNKIGNTEGCPLPGITYSEEDKEYCVWSSRTAFEKLFVQIQTAEKRGEEIWCTITADYKSAA